MYVLVPSGAISSTCVYPEPVPGPHSIMMFSVGLKIFIPLSAAMAESTFIMIVANSVEVKSSTSIFL